MTEPQLAQNDWPDMAPWKITNWKLSAAALATSSRVRRHHLAYRPFVALIIIIIFFPRCFSTFERVTIFTGRRFDRAPTQNGQICYSPSLSAVYLSTCEANACHFSRLLESRVYCFLIIRRFVCRHQHLRASQTPPCHRHHCRRAIKHDRFLSSNDFVLWQIEKGNIDCVHETSLPSMFSYYLYFSYIYFFVLLFRFEDCYRYG